MKVLQGIIFAAIAMACWSCGHMGALYPEDTYFRFIIDSANRKYNAGNRQEALLFVDSAYNQSKVSPYGKYLFYEFRAHYYLDKNDAQKHLSYADSALVVAGNEELKKKYPGEYLHALIEQGNALAGIGKSDKAYDQYVKARLVANQTLDTCGMNEINYQIAMALFRQEQYVLAVKHFKWSFDNCMHCETGRRPYYRMQELLDNIALCYYQGAKLDSAVYYFDSALSFIVNNTHNFESRKLTEVAQGVVYMNLARTMYDLNKKDSGKALLKKSISLFAKNNNDPHLVHILRKTLLDLYTTENDFGSMEPELAAIKKHMDTMPEAKNRIFWTGYVSVYYEGTGQYKQALATYRENVRLRDSVRVVETKSSNDNIVNQLNDKEQKYQITLLKKDNELKRIYLWVTIGVVVAALIVIMLVYIGYRRSRLKTIQINEQKNALQKSNREKERILHIVAHDLRNPVGNIAYLAEIMLMDGDASIPVHEAFEMIKSSSGLSLHLISELLGFNMEDEKDEKHIANLSNLIKDCAKAIEYKAKEKSQIILLHLPNLPVLVPMNEERMNRMLTNLLANAIKFSGEKSEVQVWLEKEPTYVLMKITDMGIGIPPALLPDLFKMFTTSKRKGTAGERSYGLGLAICKQIVEAHGGDLWVESKEGIGSTFFVKLPC